MFSPNRTFIDAVPDQFHVTLAFDSAYFGVAISIMYVFFSHFFAF